MRKPLSRPRGASSGFIQQRFNQLLSPQPSDCRGGRGVTDIDKRSYKQKIDPIKSFLIGRLGPPSPPDAGKLLNWQTRMQALAKFSPSLSTFRQRFCAMVLLYSTGIPRINAQSSKSVKAMSPSLRRAYYKHLGDLTLFNLGLFPESLPYGQRPVRL